MSVYLLLAGKEPVNQDLLRDDNIKITLTKLKPFSNCGKGRFANFYWWLISKSIYICEVRDVQTNEVMHYTYVMQKSYKFPFMEKNDYMIGPSVTPEQFRKRGLFTKAVGFAKNEILALNKDANFVSLVREENIAPQKGFEKAGIYITDKKYAKDKLKIYKEVKEN